MSIYTTGVMSKEQSEAFSIFLEEEVGTYFEVEEIDEDEDEFSIIICELSSSEEINAIRDYEIALSPPTVLIV